MRHCQPRATTFWCEQCEHGDIRDRFGLAGGLFLAVRLVVLPHGVTRQESFVLLCQLAQCGEQLPRLELEARQLPQMRKDKFGWPFHDLVYGRFLMPRCDVKHTTTRPVRSVASANG